MNGQNHIRVTTLMLRYLIPDMLRRNQEEIFHVIAETVAKMDEINPLAQFMSHSLCMNETIRYLESKFTDSIEYSELILYLHLIQDRVVTEHTEAAVVMKSDAFSNPIEKFTQLMKIMASHEHNPWEWDSTIPVEFLVRNMMNVMSPKLREGITEFFIDMIETIGITEKEKINVMQDEIRGDELI